MAARRYYPNYNASIFYCKDPVGQPQRYPANTEFCTLPAMERAAGGVLVIAVGAWYKPVAKGDDYLKKITAAAKLLEQDMFQLRQFIRSHAKSQRTQVRTAS
jgi:hypothetical protein